MQGHPVKGGTLLLLEGAVLSSGLNDGYYLMNKWQTRYDQAVDQDSIDYYGGLLKDSRARRNRTLAWVAGIHTWNLLDCYQYYYRRHRSGQDEVRSPRGAFLRSMVLPGWGQYYNHQYSKMGMLIMAAAGFTANLAGWQQAASYYFDLENRYRDLAAAYDSPLAEITAQIADYQVSLDTVASRLKDTTLTQITRDSLYTEQAALTARQTDAKTHKSALSGQNALLAAKASDSQSDKKRYYAYRNENIWYLVALYFYAAFDAYVDAHFSGFDQKLEMGLVPKAEGLAVNATYRF